MAQPSGSQTVGPFFKFALHHEPWNDLAAGVPAGERVYVAGRVLDGDGAPVPDAFVEIRQADPNGSYASDARFAGFGRASTDAHGRFAFTTIRPGPVASPLGLQAPHVTLSIFARGLLKQLVTRLYFDDRPGENAADPLLAAIEPARRATMVAARTGEHDGTTAFAFDIVLQGDGETAFLVL